MRITLAQRRFARSLLAGLVFLRTHVLPSCVSQSPWYYHGMTKSPTPTQVKRFRKKLGLSQPQFARKIGYSAQAVRSWEQGWRKAPARLFEIGK